MQQPSQPTQLTGSLFVDTLEQYQANVLPFVSQAKILSADFEALQGHVLALVTLATMDGRIFILDATVPALKQHLINILENTKLIVHASYQPNCSDQRALRGFGVDMSRLKLIDTQAQHDGRISLESLLEYHEIIMTPNERTLKRAYKAKMKANIYDWFAELERRPLHPDILTYAAVDVRYLLRLALKQQEARKAAAKAYE